MALLAIVDYGLIVLFFVGVASLLLVVVLPDTRTKSSTRGKTSSQKTTGAYIVLAVLFLLLVALTFLAQKEQPRGNTSV